LWHSPIDGVECVAGRLLDLHDSVDVLVTVIVGSGFIVVTVISGNGCAGVVDETWMIEVLFPSLLWIVVETSTVAGAGHEVP